MTFITHDIISLFIDKFLCLRALTIIESFRIFYVITHKNDVFYICPMIEITIFFRFNYNGWVFKFKVHIHKIGINYTTYHLLILTK